MLFAPSGFEPILEHLPGFQKLFPAPDPEHNILPHKMFLQVQVTFTVIYTMSCSMFVHVCTCVCVWGGRVYQVIILSDNYHVSFSIITVPHAWVVG